MRFKGTKLSNRTVALFAAAILLLSSGGFLGVKAAPAFTGQDYDATINLNTISVQVVDKNGKAVGKSNLLSDMKTVNPGKIYNENISVKNNGNAPAFVRLVVRKYWTDANKKIVTDPELDELLVLGMADGWTEKTPDTFTKTSVYYLDSQLEPGAKAPAIETVSVDGSIADAVTKSEKEREDGVIIYTYKYDYDGYTINIEAEAQAVQTHNAKEAIKSIWGVDATVSGTSLTVK